MDATVVASMLARGESPDLIQLHLAALGLSAIKASKRMLHRKTGIIDFTIIDAHDAFHAYHTDHRR